MPEPTHTGVIAGIVAAFTAIFGWIFRRQINRIDEHEERLSDLEKTQITSEHFDDAMTDIKTSISGVHKSVDDVWKKLAEK